MKPILIELNEREAASVARALHNAVHHGLTSARLERVRLLDVIERITQGWWNGGGIVRRAAGARTRAGEPGMAAARQQIVSIIAQRGVRASQGNGR